MWGRRLWCGEGGIGPCFGGSDSGCNELAGWWVAALVDCMRAVATSVFRGVLEALRFAWRMQRLGLASWWGCRCWESEGMCGDGGGGRRTGAALRPGAGR